ELGLFTLLVQRPGLTAEEIASELKLEDRAARGLLLGVSALGLIRSSNGEFANSREIESLVTGGWWCEFVDTLRFEARIVYPGQEFMLESLRTNRNQGLQRIAGSGDDLYRRLESNSVLREVFFKYMASWSRMALPFLIDGFNFGGVRRVLDIGGGEGTNAIEIARRFPDIRATVLDLAHV